MEIHVIVLIYYSCIPKSDQITECLKNKNDSISAKLNGKVWRDIELDVKYSATSHNPKASFE